MQTENAELTMLKPSDSHDGAFVKTLKGLTGTGFAEGTHVHKDWYARTLSFEQGFEILEKNANAREDIMAKAKDIDFAVENDAFVFKVGDRSFKPTDWALNTFATRTSLKEYSSTMMQKLQNDPEADTQDLDLMVAIAKNTVRKLESDKVFRLRTYEDGTLRAFLTDKYTPVDNRWYMQQLQNLMPAGRLSHWKSDEDTIYGNILIPDSVMDYDEDDSDYGGMISIGNCEIGKRTISQTPSLFRSICMNGCIWDSVEGKAVRRVHRGIIKLEDFANDIKMNIEKQLPLLPLGVRKFLALHDFKVNDSMVNVVALTAIENSFSKHEAKEILIQFNAHEKNDRNLFGLVNSITRAGQKFDKETWLKFDQVGGAFLDTDVSSWNRYLSRANALESAKIEKVFGNAV